MKNLKNFFNLYIHYFSKKLTFISMHLLYHEKKFWMDFRKNPLIFFSIGTLLYFDALITNMIMKITDKIIFKVKYLKTIFFTFFHAFCVENRASLRREEVASRGKSKPMCNSKIVEVVHSFAEGARIKI